MSDYNRPGDPKQADRSATTSGPVERKSPPTERVVQILELLADTPHERLTLTQIADRLGLNKPTCLGILTALADADFLTRDHAKTYGLGPALLRLGAAAETGLAELDLVRPVLTELHGQTGVGCVLSTTHRGQIIVLDHLGIDLPGDHRDLATETSPLAPPLGLVNIAWERDDVVDAWFDRAPLIPLAAGKDRVRSIIDSGRRHGYLIQQLTTNTSSNIALAALLSSGMSPRIIETLRQHLPPADWSEFLTALPGDDSATVPIATINTPVFDRHGTQRYTLSLVPNRPDATVAQCREWADAVMSAARTATGALRGR